MSVAPPAGKPTMMRTGRDGQACACAMREAAGSAAAPSRNVRRFMMPLPVCATSRMCNPGMRSGDRVRLSYGEMEAVKNAASDDSSTMFLSTFTNCLGYQRVNGLRRFFDGALTTIETYGA